MTSSSHDRVAKIEAWFHSYNDGEFTVLSDDERSKFFCEFEPAETVAYLTKSHCRSCLEFTPEIVHPLTVVARYGLPRSDDLAVLRTGSAKRLFFGDTDPVDVFIYAWLREHMPIDWHCVNDRFLHLDSTNHLSHYHIRLTESEAAAVAILPDIIPEYRELLGPYCSSFFDRGFKIELESAILVRQLGEA
jgi:hypothetical protein